MGFPEGFVLHLGVRSRECFSLKLKRAVGDGGEGKVGVLGGSLHLELL